MPSMFSSQGSSGLHSDPPSQSRSRASSFMSNFSRASRGGIRGPPAAKSREKFTARGVKQHRTFDPNVVPYPISYDQNVTSLDVLDHIFTLHSRKNNVTWVDFKDGPPKKSLDLGCGTGDWVMSAAKQWPECHFVGYDIAPNQPPATLLKQMGIEDRVRWVNGNFLTEKLPFEDNLFDHVHVYRIGWGVREDNWDGLFEEIARVLRPGGAIEIGEEDILFPVLPKSYTIKMKPRSPNPYHPSLTLSPPLSPVNESESQHAHALLESLYFGIFEWRRINCRPTSIIPHYLNIHFRNVISTPNVELPMPPPPVSRQKLRHMASNCTARPAARRSIDSASDTSSLSSFSTDSETLQQRTPATTNSSSSLLGSYSIDFDIEPPVEKVVQAISGSFGPADPLSDVKLLPPVSIPLNGRSLAIHLNTAFRRILACKEPMWEELVRRLQERNAGGPDRLKLFGWDDNDSENDDPSNSDPTLERVPGATRELDHARARFEELTTRFEKDMQHRTALADAVVAVLKWKKPAPEPVSKHERARQLELEHAITVAAESEQEDKAQAQISRSFKGFIGFKEALKLKR